MYDKVALLPRMDARFRGVAKKFKKEAANDQYEDVTASNEYVGKYIYTGMRGFTDLPRGCGRKKLSQQTRIDNQRLRQGCVETKFTSP